MYIYMHIYVKLYNDDNYKIHLAKHTVLPTTLIVHSCD